MTRILHHLAVVLLIVSCATKNNDQKALDGLESIESPSGQNASLPYLITGKNGVMYLSWVEHLDSGWVAFKYSAMIEGAWTEPALIATGNDWFVNWADYPMLAIDESGNMIAHYLAKSAAGTYSYDVNIVYKPKNGEWSDPVVPHDDGTPTEHGFVTLLPLFDGHFRIVWLDGRNTGGHDQSEPGAMTIRTAILDMEGNITDQIELDDKVCDCCQTAGTISAQGELIAYRNRSDEELRDIYYVRKINETWTVPESIYQDKWNIAGCPVNGPKMDAFGDLVAAAWFTAADGKPQVNLSFSMEEHNFNDPFIVDDTDPLGRVDVVFIDKNAAAVSWLDGGDKATIKYCIISNDGSMSIPKVVAYTSGSRGSGFPQMTKTNNYLYFAWTSIKEDKTSTVKVARQKL